MPKCFRCRFLPPCNAENCLVEPFRPFLRRSAPGFQRYRWSAPVAQREDWGHLFRLAAVRCFCFLGFRVGAAPAACCCQAAAMMAVAAPVSRCFQAAAMRAAPVSFGFQVAMAAAPVSQREDWDHCCCLA